MASSADFLLPPGRCLPRPIPESAPASCSSVEQELAEIFGRVLGVDRVGAHDDFFQLGGDSLASVELFVAIQKAFGRSLPLITLFQAPTVAQLARLLDRPKPATEPAALVELQPLGERPPFFCVHGVGGSVLPFVDLARHFAPDQPFVGVRVESLAPKERPAVRVEDLADRYVAAVRTAQPHGPYYLGGYSFGGSVALEMAHRLAAAGQEVGLLAILDHTPPPTRFRPVRWTPARVLEFAVNTAQWVRDDLLRPRPGRWLGGVRANLQALRRRLVNRLGRRGGAAGRRDLADVLDAARLPGPFRELLEANYQALREYVPRPYPGKVTLFRARTRPLFRLYGRDLGWGPLARGGLEVVRVPGNHETILKEPHVQTLAYALLARLRQAQAVCQNR